MEKTIKKRAALISRDNPTVKLINLVLNNSDISIELALSAAELNETSISKGSSPPSLIIYDCNLAMQGEELVCQPLKGYNLYHKTPKLVISTFKMDCGTCSEFEPGKCAHIQKPFKISDIANIINELALLKLSD
ncbi:MAG: hypothetical protein RQ824_01870 [bacterium]|nr:hypothetical protein [bacterium]